MQMLSGKPKPMIPSFFKILLDCTANHLPLPPAFVKNHLNGSIPKNPKLKTATGEFNLKIKKINGRFCFVNGWTKFVKDNKLESGDFLVFWLIRDSIFQVAIYGPSGCEKDSTFSISPNVSDGSTSSSSVHVIKIEDEEVVEDQTVGLMKPVLQHHPYFEKVLTLSHKSVMRLPKTFVKETGIGIKREKVMVKDPKGREWELRVKACCDGRLYLLAGWFNLLKENNILIGDTCFIQFIARGHLALKVVKRGRIRDGGRSWDMRKKGTTPGHGGGNSIPVKKQGRKRGRPPLNDTQSEGIKRKRGRPPLK